MDTNKFTKKALDAINAAQNLALERHHQQLCKEHIAYALLNDEEGLIPRLVTKCGADAPQLLREIDRILSQMPSVTGSGAGEVYLSQDASLMLSQAEKDAKNKATISSAWSIYLPRFSTIPPLPSKPHLQSVNSRKRTL